MSVGKSCLFPLAQKVPQLNEARNDTEVPLKTRSLMN